MTSFPGSQAYREQTVELSLQKRHFMCKSLFIYKSACLSFCLSVCLFSFFFLFVSVSLYVYVLGWPKSLFEFFCTILWKNWKEHLGQPNICVSVYMCILFFGSTLITDIPGVTRVCCLPRWGQGGSGDKRSLTAWRDSGENRTSSTSSCIACSSSK